jgi:hypothetical protein
MSEEDSLIGMSLAEARRRLVGFSTKRLEVMKEMQAMNVNPFGDGIPESYLKLQAQLRSLDASISETREWYNVSLLESLDETSKRLNVFTMVLIAVTCVLAFVGAVQLLKLLL